MKSKYKTALLVLKTLNNKGFFSGEDLSKKFKVSRSTIFNAVSLLKSWGIDIYAVSGKGYQLATSLEWFNEEEIRKFLSPDVQNWIETFSLHPFIDSTNTYLMKAPPPVDRKKMHLCISETQFLGRGRSNNHWLTPFGRSIACSLMITSFYSPKNLTTLPLVIALAVVQALKKLSLPTIQIKWPNDLWFQGAKLGGILIETKPSEHPQGGTLVVIGIGLNEKLTNQEKISFPYPVTDLQTVIDSHQPNFKFSKNYLLALLLEELYQALSLFETNGFQPFLEKWDYYDALKGKIIYAHAAHAGILIGKAHGITQNGLLKVISNNVEHWVHHSDVSIKVD